MSFTNPSEAGVTHDTDARLWRWVLLFGGLVLVVVLFYAEENSRGKRAWESYQREMTRRGETMDWKSFIPAPVPDEQNVFADSKMSAWFVGRGGNDLSRRLSSGRDDSQNSNNCVAQLTIIPLGEEPDPANTNLVLRYEDSVLLLDSEPSPWPKQDVIPLLILDQVPLLAAITNLARQAQFQFTIDPSTGLAEASDLPPISVRWENITAPTALEVLLERYQLTLKIGSAGQPVRIAKRDPRGPSACVSEGATRELTRAVASETSANQPSINSAQAFTTFVRSVRPAEPSRITVRADGVFDAALVERWFSGRLSGYFQVAGKAKVVSAGTNVFGIRVSPARQTAASDYLAWSDQFEPDFDHMREALRRPLVWMPGNYQVPANMPIPNFVCMRTVVQTLAQRAQCYLLLGRAEEALRELSLIHDLCRLLQPPPSGTPETLVAAMINVAISGLYVSVVGEGLRLQVWQEPQLTVIQRQLGEIRLLPCLVAALKTERASICQTLQTTAPAQVSQLLRGGPPASIWDKLKNPSYALMNLSPEGWRYQQIRIVAEQEEKAIESIDPEHSRIYPRRMAGLDKRPRSGAAVIPVFSFFLDLSPNASRAVQVVSRNQTLVNEALIMCALERCHLADGHYPARLASVIPRMLPQAPLDLFSGEPLKLSVTPDDKVLLYSVGWNATDDGGTPGTVESSGFDLDKGDWVWPFRQSFFR